MLIAISGSQGSGKSTVLGELCNRGINTIERKTARSILTEWGVALEQVYNDPVLTMQFQEEILLRKRQDEQIALLDDTQLWATERSYADLFAYTLIYLGKDNQYTDWLNRYHVLCMQAQQTYDMVYYLTAGHFDVVSDGTRSANIHYSKMADLIMRDVTEQMTLPSAYITIDTPNLNQRIERIICTSQRLLYQKKGS